MRAGIAVLFILMSAAAAGQSSSGYVFFAPGGVTCCGHTAMTVHIGAGVDAVIWKGLGANVEIGALGLRERFGDSVFGVLSPGGSYHFRRDGQRLDSFVAGGYSLAFRSGHANLGYFGGGANYWFSERTGLRMEFRDHFQRGYSATHFWGFRFGLALR